MSLLTAARRCFPCIFHAHFVDTTAESGHNYRLRSEGFPSGQRGQTVNLLAQPSKVRILPPPPGFLRHAGFWEQCRRDVCDAAGLGRWIAGLVCGAKLWGEIQGGCSSMVEQKFSKLTTRVRFPSPAPVRKRKQGLPGGAWQQTQFLRPCSSVVEHSLGKGEATSSILVMGSIIFDSGI